MREDQIETVTASQVAEWVYCPESFRLSALGHKSANQSEREGGTAHHALKATTEQVAGGSIALGRFLMLIALLAAILLFTFFAP